MATAVRRANGRSVVIEPDLQFIRVLRRQGAATYKKCFQCGTCSATCPISPDTEPFPRKEMAWAAWGMRDRLLTDPDVWLCHYCNECSVRCPRTGNPGDLMAAVRRETVLHYAAPRFLAKWASHPGYAPFLLLLPAMLLGLALLLRDPLASALGFSESTEAAIVFSYSRPFPHWLLNGFFGLFGALALLASGIGVTRFARAIRHSAVWGTGGPVKGVWASLWAAFRRIVLHDKFTSCATVHRRSVSHLLFFFGFLALTVVTLWVITGPINPLVRDGFVYPFGFWSPWKMLANVGGVAVLTGCLLMIRDRFYYGDAAGGSTFFDWALLWTLFAVVVSGFATEFLHYLRMVPHRHVVYFVHLVLVFALLIFVPYSKFAHVLYRTTAMVYAERYGRHGRDVVKASRTSGNDGRETASQPDELPAGVTP